MPEASTTLPRWAVAVLGALCATALGYTLYRSTVVTLEYYDGYEYLVMARARVGEGVGGFNLVRPPLLPLLDIPAVWLADRGAPANPGYVLGPHLIAALVAVFSVWAVYYAFAAALDRRLALLGVVLLVTGRLFVRYGSLTMADLLSMGLASLVVGLQARSMNRPPSWTRDVLLGVVIGLGATSKYPLVLMAVVVALTELLVALKRRRITVRRLRGLEVSAIAFVLTFVAVEALAWWLAMGTAALGRLPAAIAEIFTVTTGLVHPLPGETRWDNAVMIAATTAWPVLALAVLGLILLAKDREERDLPFLAWLVGMGGILIASVGHNEVPLSASCNPRADLLRRARRRVAGAPGPVASAGGSRRDRARAAAVPSEVLARPGPTEIPRFARTPPAGPPLLCRACANPGASCIGFGPQSCIYPVRRVALPRDEFFNSFHFRERFLTYFLGQPATVIPSLMAAAAGDAVVMPGSTCTTSNALPDKPPGPWIVYGVEPAPAGRLGRWLRHHPQRSVPDVVASSARLIPESSDWLASAVRRPAHAAGERSRPPLLGSLAAYHRQ